MVAVVMVFRYVPALEVRAEGRIDGAGMAIAAGCTHSLAVSQNGSLWAWGSNSHGQLGDGTVITRYTPIRIMYNVMLPPHIQN